MKKVMIIGLAMLMLVSILSLGLAGCSPASKPAVSKERLDLKWGASTPGSGGYLVVAATSAMMKKYSDWINISMIPTSVQTATATMIQQGKLDITFLNSWYAADQAQGKGAWEGKPYNGMKRLWPYSSIPVNILARAGRGISKVEDLNGKTVGTYEKGTGSYVVASAILDSLNIKPGKILYQSIADTGYSFIEGTVDAIITGHPVTAAAMIERTTRVDTLYIPLDDSHYAKMQAKYPGLVGKSVVPAKSLKGVDKDTPTFAFYAVFVADQRVPNDAIYELTKIFWDHQKEAEAIAVTAGEATPDYVRDDYPIPIHDGALKYYKEKGWVK